MGLLLKTLFVSTALQDEDVKKLIDETVNKYLQAGAEIVYLSMPSIKYSLPVYYILSSAEAASNLGRFDGIRYGKRAENFEGLTDLYVKSS